MYSRIEVISHLYVLFAQNLFTGDNAGMQKMANVMADFMEENYQAPATAD